MVGIEEDIANMFMVQHTFNMNYNNCIIAFIIVYDHKIVLLILYLLIIFINKLNLVLFRLYHISSVLQLK